MKKKLLFIYPEMMVGGSTTCLLSLLDRIDKNEYEVDLQLFLNKGELLTQIPNGVNLLPCAYKYNDNKVSKRKIVKSIFNGQALKAIFCKIKYGRRKNISFRWILTVLSVKSQVALSKINDKEYDVAIGFLELWSNAYLVSNKVKAKKKIGYIHPDYETGGFFKEGDYKVLSKLDNIVTVSKTNKINLANYYPEFRNKIVCVENIVPRELILQKSQEEIDFIKEENCLYLLTVCRITNTSKGLDRVINAFEKMKSEKWFYKIRWVIIGSGEDFEETKRLVEETGLISTIKLLGKKLNPYPYFKVANFFLLPSKYEGKPMVVEEAQIFNLPCIVTNYTSAKEQVIDGVNGIILENSDIGIEKGLREFFESQEKIDYFLHNKVICEDNSEKGYRQFLEVINN